MVIIKFDDSQFKQEFDVHYNIKLEAHVPHVFEVFHSAFLAAGYLEDNWKQACADYLEYGDEMFIDY